MGRVLGMVFAHPDDDAYAAGSVALHAADPQFRFVLVLATSGEAGAIAESSTATRETLAAVRQHEDQRAWQVLGRSPDRHEWLGYPDGRLIEVPFDELVAHLVRIFGQERPDVVVTFGPEGITATPTTSPSVGPPPRRSCASPGTAARGSGGYCMGPSPRGWWPAGTKSGSPAASSRSTRTSSCPARK
jgi:hypothetical protein